MSCFGFSRQIRLVAVLAALLALLGCAQQRIRDAANDRFRMGDYESAIATLKDGVAEYPESALLRAGLISARTEALAMLLNATSTERQAGRFDEADRLLHRAIQLDPGNDRLHALRAELKVERLVRQRVSEIEALIAANKRDLAIAALEGALLVHPRSPELLAMQRLLSAGVSASSSSPKLGDSRPITLDFRGAPIVSVLDAISRGSGVNFILDKDVRQDSRVTIFLRSASVEDALDLVTAGNQLSRRIVDSNTVLVYPNTPEKQREHQEQVIRVFRLGTADAKATAAMLRTVLRVRDPFIDERANLVVIRESPEIVELAQRLVALQDQGEAEVMLEVEIMEISRARLTELGLSFPSSVSFSVMPPAGQAGLTVDNLRGLDSSRVGVSVGSILLNLQRQVGDTNLLANPRIRAKNREKARIMIGDRVPVVTTTTNSTGFVAESISYLDVGLKLDVEPIVAPDDDVTIKMALEVSSIAKEIRTGTGSIAYQLGSRNASTTLRLRDGETQLLGGLISNEERMSASRLPILGDLPVAGRLFSSQRDDGVRTELVLAITPRILRAAPRVDAAQAELWVGTESAMRLRSRPAALAAPTARREPSASSGVAAAAMAPAAAASAQQASLPAATGPTQFFITPASIQARTGDSFTIDLELASAAPLRGTALELSYPIDTAELVEVLEGPYFRQNSGTSSFTSSPNPQTGRIGVGVLRNDTAGAMGKGTVLQLKFRAKAPGKGEVKLISARPLGASDTGERLPLPSVPITVQ